MKTGNIRRVPGRYIFYPARFPFAPPAPGPCADRRSTHVFRLALPATLLAASLLTTPMTATRLEAGTIENACRSSSRGASQAALCHCIQKVASVSLSRSEQRTVSKWFADPHKAQEVRQSAKRSDAQLWEKYKLFGNEAERVCG